MDLLNIKDCEMYKFQLYILKDNTNSIRAIEEIRRIFENEFHNQYTLDIIDLFMYPEKAQENSIFATPTLIKVSPAPIRRIIGDMSDRNKVLNALSLDD